MNKFFKKKIKEKNNNFIAKKKTKFLFKWINYSKKIKEKNNNFMKKMLFFEKFFTNKFFTNNSRNSRNTSMTSPIWWKFVFDEKYSQEFLLISSFRKKIKFLNNYKVNFLVQIIDIY